jgi:hypothetical protein
MSLNPFCIKGQHGEQLVSHNGKRYHNPSVKSPGIEDATHLIRKNKYATLPELHVWEDMGRSSRIQMSSIFANLKDLKKTRSRPGPSRDVASLCSMRSFLCARISSIRLFFSSRWSLRGEMPRRNTFSEHVNFLMSTWCLHLKIPFIAYPILSYPITSGIIPVRFTQRVTDAQSRIFPMWKNTPFGHLSMTNVEKKYQPLSLVHLKGGCSSQTWELNEPNCTLW